MRGGKSFDGLLNLIIWIKITPKFDENWGNFDKNEKSFEANFSPNLTAKCIKCRLVEYTPAESRNKMRIGLPSLLRVSPSRPILVLSACYRCD